MKQDYVGAPLSCPEKRFRGFGVLFTLNKDEHLSLSRSERPCKRAKAYRSRNETKRIVHLTTLRQQALVASHLPHA